MKNYQKVSILLFILTAFIIFYVSSKPTPPNPFPTFSLMPIIYHFGIFCFLTYFLLVSKKVDLTYFLFILIFSLVYAGLDEFHQYFVPGRACDIADFLVDSAGIFWAGIFYYTTNKFINY